MGFYVTKTIQLLWYQPLGNLPFAGGDAISDIAAAANLWQRHRLLRLGYWEMFMKNGGFQCKNMGESTKYGGFVSWEIHRSKWEIFQQTRSQLAGFWSTSNFTGFPKSWGYPKNHQFCSWDFPWNKPFSYWGNSIYGTPTCLPECWGCHSRNTQGCDHAQFWPRAILAACRPGLLQAICWTRRVNWLDRLGASSFMMTKYDLRREICSSIIIW